MLLNAELLLSYQRCRRRTFLDTYGDPKARDTPSDLLLQLQQARAAHRQAVLSEQAYHQPDYPKGDWEAGSKATLALMQQGVDQIHRGVLLSHFQPSEEITSSSSPYTPYIPSSPPQSSEQRKSQLRLGAAPFSLISRPDLLIKQPGKSNLGDWIYIPAQIELGKRPKQEYQIVAAYNAQVLAAVQGAVPQTAYLILRARNNAARYYVVYLSKWIPQMYRVLEDCIETLQSPQTPEVFITRQRCSLCRWYSYCYESAKSQQHLSLLPGVTPSRYAQLQALNLTSIQSLANANPAQLAPVFSNKLAAQHLILQAQSILQQQPILLNSPPLPLSLPLNSPVELYFDIEAEPDLNLDYLLGVLVVDRRAKTETFHCLLAEQPEAEELIWQQFLDLVWQYPQAPIFHFCSYEVDTVKRLAKLYHTPPERTLPLMNRFVDVYEQVTQAAVLPVESYALKSIARWLGFNWRDPQANGSQCIYWYKQWLETSDRTLLDTIRRYNEDDCRATHRVKDWLTNFVSVQVSE